MMKNWWGPNLPRACGSTTECIDKKRDTEYSNGGVFEEAIMLCTNWVCAGTFVDYEWVSESTISKHEEETLAMELDYRIDVPCMEQRSLLWFSSPTRLKKIGTRIENQ